MATAWFILVALMLVAYVVLDGFDIGAGIIHLLIGRTDDERRTVIRTIGPVWDGNEVWLLAAGGTLYFAFPLLYASSFSGFYLPLIMVLWLLILRAIGIDFRTHLQSPLWRKFFDGIFAFSSVLLAIFYGAALGNVIRGVPLDANGVFFEALWTNWRIGPDAGILDWYTVMAAVVALLALAMHGALYVAMKTSGELNQRARRIANYTWPLLLLFTFISLAATIWIRPQLTHNYRAYPVGLLIPVLVFGALAALFYFHGKGRELAAFYASSAYLAGMLGGAAFGLYPNLLPASTDAAFSITIHSAATGTYGMRVGLVWWSIGILIAIAYFVFLYRMFRGKVSLEGGEQGY